MLRGPRGSKRRASLGVLLRPLFWGLPCLTSAEPSASRPFDWDPRVPGPYSVAKPISVLPRASDQDPSKPPFELVAFVPGAPGDYPVAAFVPGFLGSPSFYSGLFSHIASHGIAVLGLDIPPLRTATEGMQKRAQDVADSLAFITADGGAAASAAVAAAGGPSGMRLDAGSRLILLAHSIGGHALLQVLEKLSCFNAQLAVVLDPVDGLDPFGFEPEYLLPLGNHPEVALNFSLPLALIMSGYGATPVGPSILHLPPCAPVARAGLHWYDSMQVPKWLVNMTDFGHFDFGDEGVPIESSRPVCPPGPAGRTPESRAAYRSTVGGLVVALAEALIQVPGAPVLPAEARLAWLEEPQQHLAPLRATGMYDRMGATPQAGCSRPQADLAEVLL